MRKLNMLKNVKDMLKNVKNSISEIHEQSKKLVNRNEIALVNEGIRKIEALLEFRTHGKLDDALKDTFKTWLEVIKKKSENEKAEIVLSYFLQEDKIWDSLTRSLEFAEGLDETDDIKAIPKIFVNQYLYFLRKNVNSMHEKCSLIQEAAPLLPTKENVLRFICEECFSVPSIKDIPSAYEALGRLNTSLEKSFYEGKEKTVQQIRDISNISNCFELLNESSKDNYSEDIEKLQQVQKELLNRLAKMNSNIEKSKDVYHTIINCMTDEWFDDFYPEVNDSKVSKIAFIDELRKFYFERLSFVSSKLESFI